MAAHPRVGACPCRCNDTAGLVTPPRPDHRPPDLGARCTSLRGAARAPAKAQRRRNVERGGSAGAGGLRGASSGQSNKCMHTQHAGRACGLVRRLATDARPSRTTLRDGLLAVAWPALGSPLINKHVPGTRTSGGGLHSRFAFRTTVARDSVRVAFKNPHSLVDQTGP